MRTTLILDRSPRRSSANDTIFQIGKQGIGYLLNESKLGGIGGEEFSLKVCNAAFGGTAYVSPVIYVPCTNGLFALKVEGSTFSVLWNDTGFYAEFSDCRGWGGVDD